MMIGRNTIIFTLLYLSIAAFSPGEGTICFRENGEVVQNGDTYNVDSCTTCTCTNGELLCRTHQCPEFHCRPYYEELRHIEGFCCPICVQIRLTEHPRIMSESDLECENANCPTACPVGQAMQPVSGQCCSFVCVDPQHSPALPPPDLFGLPEDNNQCEGEGEFVDPEHPCDKCSCSNGIRACFTPSCPKLSCEETVKVPDECCPTCKTAEPRNIRRRCVEGSTKVDGCSNCVCISGRFHCLKDESLCPPPPPPPPQCIEDTIKIEDCMRCLCFGGKYHCFHEEELCEQPTPPSCREDSIKREDCLRCICLGGEFHCFHDIAHCGPEEEASESAMASAAKYGEVMTYTSGDTGCYMGERKRMPGCMRCRCNDGVKFSCFYDSTLCRQPSGGSKSSKKADIARLINEALKNA